MNAVSDSVIGFIGLGVMGGSMCYNIAKKHPGDVLAFDLNPKTYEILRGTKAVIVSTISDLARQADIIFLSLPGSAQVESVCLSDDILNLSKRRVSTIVDLSTTSVATSKRIAKLLSEHQIQFVDAPVARTREAAQRGELSIMVGSTSNMFENIQSILHYMGTDVTHCGDVGCGQVVKLINNALVFEHTVALAEMMILGQRAGVEPNKLLDAVSKGSGNSFVLENHGRKAMLSRSFPDHAFPPEYVIKDLSYVQELAHESELNVPLVDLAKQYYKSAVSSGCSGRYFPSVIEVVERDIGPEDK